MKIPPIDSQLAINKYLKNNQPTTKTANGNASLEIQDKVAISEKGKLLSIILQKIISERPRDNFKIKINENEIEVTVTKPPLPDIVYDITKLITDKIVPK